MAKDSTINREKPKRAPTLYVIVIAKLAEGGLLLIAALSFYLLAKQNLPELFDQFIRWIHLDPEGRFFNAISDQLDTVTPRNVHVLASWLLLYGLFKTIGWTYDTHALSQGDLDEDAFLKDVEQTMAWHEKLALDELTEPAARVFRVRKLLASSFQRR